MGQSLTIAAQEFIDQYEEQQLTHTRIKGLFPELLSLLAGSALPFAFAPFYLFFIASMPIALLFWSWTNVTPRRAALRGLLFGLGFFGVGVSWVFISIHRFGGTGIPLAMLLTSLFIISLTLFLAVQGYLVAWLFTKNNLLKLLLVFPAYWVLFEWLRGYLFTGFPWLFLGFSQTNGPLSGFAPIIGSYGISFLVAFRASLLVMILIYFTARLKWIHTTLSKISGKQCILAISFFIGLCLIGLPLKWINWTQPSHQPLRVSLIQGNIPQSTKWSPDEIFPTLDLYKNLTRQHWNSDLIVWPEGALPVPFHLIENQLGALSEQAIKHNTTIIFGIPVQASETKFLNAAIVIGKGHGVYFKRHLVPFGEYLPFESMLRGLINFFNIPMSDFIPGKSAQPLLVANHIKIAPYICYEVAYASLVRSDLPDAQLLMTISDDAWFGDSFAAAQHVQMGQMRSIESGRYMLFSTNNGLTAIINPHGKILKKLPKFKKAVLTSDVYPMNGKTPWIILGDWPILVVCLFIILLGVARQRDNK